MNAAVESTPKPKPSDQSSKEFGMKFSFIPMVLDRLGDEVPSAIYDETVFRLKKIRHLTEEGRDSKADSAMAHLIEDLWIWAGLRLGPEDCHFLRGALSSACWGCRT